MIGAAVELRKLPFNHYKESVNCKTLIAVTEASDEPECAHIRMHAHKHWHTTKTKHTPLPGPSVVVSLVDHQPGPQGSQRRPHVYSMYVYSAAVNGNERIITVLPQRVLLPARYPQKPCKCIVYTNFTTGIALRQADCVVVVVAAAAAVDVF